MQTPERNPLRRFAFGAIVVIAMSDSDEAIHSCFAAPWIASLRSQ
jgi:hypothetical protein